MVEYYSSGMILRCSQIFIDASIWIAFGCFIAAIFRYMIGAEKTRGLFGNQSRFGLLIGWSIGMLLPVCSLGVIPVVRELHRAGVKPGTIIAFGLTAPLFNPLSILYGLSLPDPFAVIIFSGAAMVIVTAVGAIWGKFFHGNEDTEPVAEEPLPANGVRRSMAVLHGASTELSGWSLMYIAIGILASAAVAVSFEHGSLQGETEPDKVFAPVFMAGYISPIYSTPLLAMSQIGGMFQHGNSIGAAFALLVLGAGINVGVICWFTSAFGLKRVCMFLLLLLTLTIGIAYAVEKPLYPEGVLPAGHTHAFDIYTHPYPKSDSGLMEFAVNEAKEYSRDNAFGGPRLIFMMIVVGVLFRVIQMRWDLFAWYQKTTEGKKNSRLEVALPSWVVGVVSCVFLVVISVIGTYVYYPNPRILLNDLSALNTNCVMAAKTDDWEGVRKWVPYCDDLSRRLEVGLLLRDWSVSDFQRAKARVYREKLNIVRDNIDAGQISNIDAQAMELHQSYLQMSKAFRPQGLLE